MGWRAWFGRRAEGGPNSDRDDSFVPGEWGAYFRAMTPECRRAAAVAVCRAVLAAVPLAGLDAERLLDVLGRGVEDPDAAREVGTMVGRLEGEYHWLIGAEGEWLGGGGPEVDAAFAKARAATALWCALEGEFANMAYEAWSALDCPLDRLRGLVQMAGPD